MLIGGFLVQALALGSLPLVTAPAFTLLGLFVAFCAVPSVNAAAIGFVMAITPTRLQGRVGSAVSMLSLATTPAATLLAGWGVAEFGMRATVGAFAASFAVAILLAMASRIRSIPKPEAWERYGERHAGDLQD